MYIQTSNQEKLELGFRNYSCNWGVHIAGLYETPEERDEIIFGFFHAGMEAGDLQLYSPAERSPEDFIAAYSKSCPNCGEAVHDTNHFTISPSKEIYYPDGTFSPKAMDESLTAFYNESQKEKKTNIRATAEMIWALESIPGKEYLFAYESRLNYFIPPKPWISICLYNISRFSGSTILDVLRTHPYTINKGVFMENPYYQDPDIWLRDNAPQFLPENMN